MANRLTGKILYFDQFNADATLANVGETFIVRHIITRAAGATDIFQLEDQAGNAIFLSVNPTGQGAGKTYNVFSDNEGYNFGNNGVIIDVSDCTGMDATDGTDAVWIYLA